MPKPTTSTENVNIEELRIQLEDKNKQLHDSQEMLNASRLKAQEYEMYQRAERHLIDWAKKRFWWIVVLGGIILGTSGYGLIQSTLASANKSTTEATVAADAAKDQVANANRAIGELQGSFTTIQKDIGSLESRIEKVHLRITGMEGVFASRAKDYEDLDRDIAKAVNQEVDLSQDIDSLEGRVEQLDQELSLLLEEANGDRFLAHFLFRCFIDLTSPSMERKAAVVAMGLIGERASSRWGDLVNYWREHLHEENTDIQQALTLALLRIDPDRTQKKYLEFMEDDLTPDSVKQRIRFADFRGPLTIEGVRVIGLYMQTEADIFGGIDLFELPGGYTPNATLRFSNAEAQEAYWNLLKDYIELHIYGGHDPDYIDIDDLLTRAAAPHFRVQAKLYSAILLERSKDTDEINAQAIGEVAKALDTLTNTE